MVEKVVPTQLMHWAAARKSGQNVHNRQAPAALAVRANIYKNHQRIPPQALPLAVKWPRRLRLLLLPVLLLLLLLLA
jgi:hypothetical protein